MREDAYAAYRDPDGLPMMVESCVLFADVLGVQAMSQAPNATDLLRRLRLALDRGRERAGTEDPDMPHASTWFTDNVVIGTPVAPATLDVEQALGYTQIDVSYLFLHLLDEGFLARGAITYGLHYMEEHFVFGPALIEASELEKSTRWPRVALSPFAASLNREVVDKFYGGDPTHAPQASELLVDEHGDVFVDPVGIWLDEEDEQASVDYHLTRMAGHITDALREHAAGPIFDKWKWAADYFNYTLASYEDLTHYMVPAEAPVHGFVSFGDTF